MSNLSNIKNNYLSAPNSPVNFGLINFTNCLPINYALEKWDIENVILHKGNPAQINKLMKDGQVQVAPVSSIEYIRNQKDYVLIKEACITSDAECGSVILFSNYELDDLQGKRIGLPHNSATSVNMLKVILKEKGISLEKIKFSLHEYKLPLSEALSTEFDAVLYIGDQALISRIENENKIIQYDLGRLWKDLTGLPPVFGTWVARADWAISHKDDFNRVKILINKAVEAGLGIYFNEVIEKASLNLNLAEDIIRDYLTAKIKYSFTSEQEKSLNFFKELFNNLN